MTDRTAWVRLRAALDNRPNATQVTINRETAEEMLAEIRRLRDACGSWTYIKKGDKRPLGRVLVAHGWPDAEWKLRAAIFGDADEPPPNRIDIAIWHPDTSKWSRSGPRLDYLKGVYAWMPLPEAPEQEEQP